MAVKDIEGTLSVVEAAKIRIKNAFDTELPIILSISGGKDSIVLAHLVYSMILSTDINPKQLTVQFVDEEAIFEDVEKAVLDWRSKFLKVGSKFDWYCVEVKHFNCLNSLDDDESFILWDHTQKDNWVRPMPPFAITDHKLLRKRKDNYQEFLPRINRGSLAMIGVRTQESSMRRNNIAQLLSNKGNKNSLNADNSLFPIYDFTDDDIWLYIKENKLYFPITYMHLYQTGGGRRDMRLSQFFSIDTAKSLVKLSEYEPELMTKVIKREPNAYLAALYWDTDMFRRGEKNVDSEQAENKIKALNYKDEVFKMFKKPSVYFNSPSKEKTAQAIRRLIMRDAMKLNDKHYKLIYLILLAGDPKSRAFRGLLTTVQSDFSNESKKELKNKEQL